MPRGSLYKSYGINPTAPGEAFIDSSEQASDALTDAFSNVGDILKKQEQIYTDRNTYNMQEYVKGAINNEGLNAKPLDMAQIKHQFGKYIDTDAIASTEEKTRSELKIGALNKASILGNDTYSNNNDSFAAVKAFKSSLINSGYDEADAAEASEHYIMQNTYRDEEHKRNNQQQLNNSFITVRNRMRDGDSRAEAVDSVASSLSPELQSKFFDSIKANLDNRASLNSTQTDAVNSLQLNQQSNLLDYLQKRAQQAQKLFSGNATTQYAPLNSKEYSVWLDRTKDTADGGLEKLFNDTDSEIIQKKVIDLYENFDIPKDIARRIVQSAANDSMQGNLASNDDIRIKNFNASATQEVKAYVSYLNNKNAENAYNLSTEQQAEKIKIANKRAVAKYTSMLHKNNIIGVDTPQATAVSRKLTDYIKPNPSDKAATIQAQLNAYAQQGANNQTGAKPIVYNTMPPSPNSSRNSSIFNADNVNSGKGLDTSVSGADSSLTGAMGKLNPQPAKQIAVSIKDAYDKNPEMAIQQINSLPKDRRDQAMQSLQSFFPGILGSILNAMKQLNSSNGGY